MKYDLTRCPTKGALRVLGALTSSLFSLLCKKRFEDIKVGEICEVSGYPRATFYNYFDDKYDLLNFYWYAISKHVKFEEYERYGACEVVDIYFDRLYDLLEQYEGEIRKIIVYNTWDGYFIASCKIYLTESIKTMLHHMEADPSCPVPEELMAEHYANTMLLIFGRRFAVNDSSMTKERTRQYLEYLIKK